MTRSPPTPAVAVVAHRGASERLPENTIVAAESAFTTSPAAHGLEFDVRLSADGVPMVFHDADTTRLTGEPGTIESRTRAEIRALAVGGEPIPTLADMLAAVLPRLARTSSALLNVELKPTGAAAALVAACRPLLDPLVGAAPLVVSSFDARLLSAIIEAGAGWPLAFLYETLDALEFLRFIAHRAPLDLHPCHELVDADHLGRHRAQEYPGPPRAFRVWTVDDAPRARELAALGVDAIITNTPNRLRRQLEEGAP